MSPDLEKAISRLERKASTAIRPKQQRVLIALQEIGATRVVATLQSLLQQDAKRKAEALAEAARLRKNSFS